VRFGKIAHKTLIYGTTPNYPRFIRHGINQGKFFTQLDVDSRRRVCVLGEVVRRKLFGTFSPLGEVIRIGKRKFTCLGTMKKKGTSFGFDLDNIVFIPLTTAQALFETSKVLEIVAWVKDKRKLEFVRQQIRELLIKRHMDEEDFHFHLQGEILSMLGVIINMLSGFITAIAGVSLLVGGIGITNLMLSSLDRRTREIGIRKAIGARGRDILYQFLFEASLVGVGGGLIGLLVGILGSAIITWALGIPFVVPLWIIFAALGFCTGIGILAGIFPAIRASRLSPIEALRYE
jgi:putative ABC transport system permease protein